MNKLKKWLGYYNGKATKYSGQGFLQGMGMSVDVDIFEIKRLGIRIVKDVHISVDTEWMRNLKRRMKEDDKQQELEKSAWKQDGQHNY